MRRVNFHLTDQQKAALEQIRGESGIKVAELIRRAIDEYIQNRGRGRDAERKNESLEDTS